MNKGESKPIDVMWKSYRKDVIPDTAPEQQVIGSHQAFIGGACAMFYLIMMAAKAPTENDADEIMAIIGSEVDTIRTAAINEFIKTMPVGGHA